MLLGHPGGSARETERTIGGFAGFVDSVEDGRRPLAASVNHTSPEKKLDRREVLHGHVAATVEIRGLQLRKF